MKAVLDTSALIASFLKTHEFHQPSAAWLSAAQARSLEMIVSAHTLAELYATLTRMPQSMKVPPAKLWRMIDVDILAHATVRTLPAAGYTKLIKRLAANGIVGAVVYDAVIVEVARLAKADALLTLNVSHFQRVWPDDAGRILSPLTSSPPAPDAH